MSTGFRANFWTDNENLFPLIEWAKKVNQRKRIICVFIENHVNKLNSNVTAKFPVVIYIIENGGKMFST